MWRRSARFEAGATDGLALAQAAYAALAADLENFEEQAFVRRVYLDALEAAGKHEEARGARQQARAWLTERASRITSAHYRRTFLHEEPDNARIMGSAPTPR